MELIVIGQVQIWKIVEKNDPRISRHPLIVHWVKMKQKLKWKYVVCDYQDDLYDQLTTLKQGGMMVPEYMEI